MIILPHFINTYRGIEVEKFSTETEDNLNLIDLLEKRDTLYIIVNFGIARASIIEMLSKQKKYKFFDKNIYIEIQCKDFETYLCDFSNKFLQDFSGYKEGNLLLKSDKSKGISCTVDAKKEFLKTITRSNNIAIQYNIFNKIFPQPINNEWDYWLSAKNNVSAIMYVKKSGEYNNIYSYDIKKSFPARIYKGLFPQGHGIYFTNNDILPLNKWYIKRIAIFKLKPKIYDFLGLISKHAGDTLPIVEIITKEIEEILNLYYDINYKTIDGFFYKMQKSIFDEFFENNFFNEANKNKCVSIYNKAKNNLLIGSFGANDYISENRLIFKQNQLYIKNISYENAIKSYYPLYLYVNGAAKCEFIKILAKYFNNIIYINTDGFFSTKEIDFSGYNLLKVNNIGNVEFRGKYKKIAIKEISNYCGIFTNGDIDIRLKGRRQFIKSYDEFINGFKSYSFAINKSGFLKMYEYQEKGIKEFEV